MGLEVLGKSLIEASTELVREVLKGSPDGLSNQEVGERTGLWLDIPEQRGWISWTILRRLMETGEVTKDGPNYRLVKR